MLESKQQQESEVFGSNYGHVIGELPRTVFFPVLTIALILFVGLVGAFQPFFIFAQSANRDPAIASHSNITATTITLPVAPITIGNQFYQEAW